jgi:hypothetical protein
VTKEIRIELVLSQIMLHFRHCFYAEERKKKTRKEKDKLNLEEGSPLRVNNKNSRKRSWTLPSRD